MIAIRGKFGGTVMVHRATGTRYFRLYETDSGDVSVIATPQLADRLANVRGLVRVFGICDPRPFATLKAAHGLDLTADVMVLGEDFRLETDLVPEQKVVRFGEDPVFAHRGFVFPETLEIGAKGRNGWIHQSGLNVQAWRARHGDTKSDYLHIEALNSQGRGGAAIMSVHGAVVGELAALLAEVHASSLSPQGRREFVAEMARRLGVDLKAPDPEARAEEAPQALQPDARPATPVF